MGANWRLKVSKPAYGSPGIQSTSRRSIHPQSPTTSANGSKPCLVSLRRLGPQEYEPLSLPAHACGSPRASGLPARSRGYPPSATFKKVSSEPSRSLSFHFLATVDGPQLDLYARCPRQRRRLCRIGPGWILLLTTRSLRF